MFDIDDFKAINDTLGHAAGDEVLREVCRVIDPLIRPADTFARTGGEEFWLLLPETTQLDALLVAERVRTAIARRHLLPGRQVTVSGGVAALGGDGHTREEVERRADKALYWAKRNGKNMCAVASEAILEDAPAAATGMISHLHAMVAGIDAQHLHTRDHSENVASYAVAIGQALGLDPERVVKLRLAALLHDIGKVAVDDQILAKPAALTDEEFAQIRVHPEIGATMLNHAGLREEARWVRHHHERVDGTGYPDAIAGNAIPLESRILFVADAFEAMTSDRPYRRGVPVGDALEELRVCAGSQFDPVVVEALEALVTGGRLAVLALRDAA
jgi:diguanylate cyclase (GGDEF)-like protein/putative nucleotidyltransferase with HDIG domain